jgi:hypothetical protein
MKNELLVESGMNRTGVMISPLEATKTMEGAVDLTVPPPGDESAIAENRIRFKMESGSLGTIPYPTNFKGAYTAIKENMIYGHHVFLDKLGERIAFERTGTRIYEALLSKYHGTEDKEGLPPLERLEQFYLEEKKHFEMACEVMTKIGGDPTAMTPSADICGVAGAGWIQVIGDPRTNFLQSLEIVLQAELVDNACWETLIELAENLDLIDAVDQFQIALEEENVHLAYVKSWVSQLNVSGKVEEDLFASDEDDIFDENITAANDDDDIAFENPHHHI